MLVNIIHPYIYKLKGNELIIGPIQEFTERDQKVSDFVKTALDNEIQIFNYDRVDLDRPLGAIMHATALIADPLYSFIKDKRINIVMATGYGLILPEEKPDEISDENWNYLCEIYSNWPDLRSKIQNSSPALFIGGALEACLANAAINFSRQFDDNRQQIFYVPELCVSVDSDFLEKEALPKLEERGINPLSYEEALSLIQTSTCN